MRFVVNVDGTTSHVKVVKGKAVFHVHAIIAISKSRFAPARQDGEPFLVWMTHVIRFRRPKPKAMPPPVPSNAASENVFDISSVDVKSIVIHSVPPVYPEWARFTGGDKGVVNLKFKVNVDGSVTDVDASILKGGEIFRKPSNEAVTRFRYKPAERDGNPVPVWIKLPFTFAFPEDQADVVPETVEPGAGN